MNFSFSERELGNGEASEHCHLRSVAAAGMLSSSVGCFGDCTPSNRTGGSQVGPERRGIGVQGSPANGSLF